MLNKCFNECCLVQAPETVVGQCKTINVSNKCQLIQSQEVFVVVCQSLTIP